MVVMIQSCIWKVVLLLQWHKYIRLTNQFSEFYHFMPRKFLKLIIENFHRDPWSEFGVFSGFLFQNLLSCFLMASWFVGLGIQMNPNYVVLICLLTRFIKKKFILNKCENTIVLSKNILCRSLLFKLSFTESLAFLHLNDFWSSTNLCEWWHFNCSLNIQIKYDKSFCMFTYHDISE